MGYYTNYTLTAKIQKPQAMPTKEALSKLDKEELVNIIAENKEWYNKSMTADDIIYIFNEDKDIQMHFEGNGDTAYECKWYEHDEDMRNFSKKYPNVLFLLEGKGEESEDVWRKYYQDGKCQECHAKLVFDEYDPAKLK
jgi:hypothetical protein